MRSRWILLSVLGFAACLGGRAARAESSMLVSGLVCGQVGAVVACKVRVESRGLSRITWATATVEQLPDFVSTRNGFARFKADGTSRPNLLFFLEPKRSGQGVMRVRLQASVCPEHGPMCESVNRVVEGVVTARK